MRNRPAKTVSAADSGLHDMASIDAPAQTNARRFRTLLHSPQLEFLLEAHNGISAKIAEEAGFKGLWASGLCLSAQFGVRDSNEASWTQLMEMLEFMSDAVDIPILLDGDTGYGNFNNVRRLVRKLEQREIAAVCIEDKLFPKTNSFIGGDTQPLADIDEFCGKIKAAKDVQKDDDFCIIARVEALIAGWGLHEALRRAEAYHQAGADGILIHSALRTADEVLAFQKDWQSRCPVVCVPTKYYATPTDVLRDNGFSIAIWANHLMRSAITSMQNVAQALAAEQNLLVIEDRIAPVAEVFRLQGAAQLEEDEKRYLPQHERGTRAIVLAASRGKELGRLTRDVPKAMVEIRGQPLLAHIVSAYNAVGIKHITVVRGYKKHAVTLPNVHYVDNDDYLTTGELDSFAKALLSDQDDKGDLIVSYGDVLSHKYVIQILTEMSDDFVIAVDTDWQESVNRHRAADYVQCSTPHSRRAFYDTISLTRIDEEMLPQEIHGEWMGFLKVGREALPRLRHCMEDLSRETGTRSAKLLRLLNELVARGESIRVVYTTGHWLDVDSVEDVVAASNFG